MAAHVRKQKDELILSYGEKKILADQILDKNEDLMNLEREKNQSLSENYILENQVKELMQITSTTQEEKHMLLEQKGVLATKNALLEKEVQNLRAGNANLENANRTCGDEISMLKDALRNQPEPNFNEEYLEDNLVKFASQIDNFALKIQDYEQAVKVKDKQIELLNELVRLGGRRRDVDESIAGTRSMKYSRYTEGRDVGSGAGQNYLTDSQIAREIDAIRYGQSRMSDRGPREDPTLTVNYKVKDLLQARDPAHLYSHTRHPAPPYPQNPPTDPQIAPPENFEWSEETNPNQSLSPRQSLDPQDPQPPHIQPPIDSIPEHFKKSVDLSQLSQAQMFSSSDNGGKMDNYDPNMQSYGGHLTRITENVEESNFSESYNSNQIKQITESNREHQHNIYSMVKYFFL
jgi:hypothetical protein